MKRIHVKETSNIVVDFADNGGTIMATAKQLVTNTFSPDYVERYWAYWYTIGTYKSRKAAERYAARSLAKMGYTLAV